MKVKILLLAIGLMVMALHTNAQAFIGMWEVTNVTVGDRQMTPVARWFKINEDETFQGGNGWTQNSYGTWTFDERKKTFAAVNLNGVKDEFGPFAVSYSGDTLKWERDEEGMKVIVSLIEADEMPIAPVDEIQGLWQLTNVTKDNAEVGSTYDPDQQQFVFIRPDRRYRFRNPDGQVHRGIWHMDGHRPVFTFINGDRDIKDKVFSIQFRKEELVMKQQGGDQLTFIYNRIFSFPE